MRNRGRWLAVALALVCGSLGGWAVAAQQKHFDRDAAEMDRTTEVLVSRVRGINEKLKTLARGVTADKLEDPEKKFEKQLGESLQPFLEDANVLFIQTFLLAMDNAIDSGGAAVEGFFLAEFSKRVGAPAKELTERQEKSGLGVGGVVLGYAIAKAANVSADEIFANKADNKSWPEVMRARQVSLAQLQELFEDKK